MAHPLRTGLPLALGCTFLALALVHIVSPLASGLTLVCGKWAVLLEARPRSVWAQPFRYLAHADSGNTISQCDKQ